MRPDRFSGLEPDLVRLLLPIAETRFPEQVMALSWWEDDRRATGLVLLALGAELDMIPDKVTDPTLGAVRFAFWREVIEEIEARKARAHPVAQALLCLRQTGPMPETAPLFSLIDLAEERLPFVEGGATGDESVTLSFFLPLLGRAAGGTEQEVVSLGALGSLIAVARPDLAGPFEATWRDCVPLPPAISPVAAAGRLTYLNRVKGPKSLFRQRLSLLRTILQGR